MAATTTLLGLVTPTQGSLPGVWGDTVNYGITEYLDIAIAGTLTLTGDGTVILANTTGSSSGTNITSTLSGAGTVTAQFAIVKVSGTTGVKIVQAPSFSRTYLVVNASSFAVTFKPSAASGVSIAAGETASVYYNGTDYVKVVGTATAGAAGGSTTQVQYNNAGVLAGITGATTDGTALTLVAPVLGTPASATLTLATGLPISTGVSGLGTNVATALGVNTGSAGAFVVNGGALGSPSSVGTMPAFTLGGTVSGGGNQINNVIIGTTTPLAGAFTSLTASTTLGVTGVSTLTAGAVVQGLTVGLGAGAVAGNTAVGVSALAGNSTGARLTAVGASAGVLNTASDNSFVGYNAGTTNTSGINNTALGSQALYTNSVGGNNTAIGYTALLLNTGSNNTAVGGGPYPYATLGNNSSGAANTAVGTSALAQNTTASNNTAVGYQAGYTNSTGADNTFIGYQAGYTSAASTTGANTAIGRQAGYSLTTGTDNTVIGQGAGYGLTSGSYNTFIGSNFAGLSSGQSITTGSKNSILGNYSGNNGGLDIRTASNYIVLSDGDGNPRGIFDDSGNFLVNATSATALTTNCIVARATQGTLYVAHELGNTGSNFGVFAYDGTVIGSISQSGTTAVLYNVTSDQRLKENIVDAPEFGSVIDLIKVRSYDWKADGNHQRAGFIAQELVTVAPEAVHQPTDTDEMMAVDYSKLVPMLVKELQSLRARVAQLESKP